MALFRYQKSIHILTFPSIVGIITTLTNHSEQLTTLRNPTLYCFSNSSLILTVHSGFILLHFYLIGFMVGLVGMQCFTISVSIPGMSSYDHAKTSLNSIRSATNASFSKVVRVLPTCIILGSSSISRFIDQVSSFMGSRCPCFNSLLLRVSLPILEIKTFKANK